MVTARSHAKKAHLVQFESEQRKAAENDPASLYLDELCEPTLGRYTALPVFALREHELELHPLADRPAQIRTDRMRQPARGFQKLFL